MLTGFLTAAWTCNAAEVAGTLFGWGWNVYGQSAAPADLTNVTAMAGSEFRSLALRSNRTVVLWGNVTPDQTVPAGLTNVVAIASGYSHNLALSAAGNVTAWGGDNLAGETTVPSDLTNAVAIAAGAQHSLALRRDRTVTGWGNNSFSQSAVPAGLTNVIAVAAGGNQSLALTGNGIPVAWGAAPAIPAGLGNVTAIAAGAAFALALKADGTIVAWGDNNFGQTNVPAGLSNVTAIAAGDNHALALTAEGKVIGWGYAVHGEAWVPANVVNAKAIGAGRYQSLVILGNDPFVIGQPLSQAANSGTSPLFEVEVAGLPPFAFQWQLNGTNIANATNSTLTVENAQSADGGNYRAVITNAYGSATSSNASLSVFHTPPMIIDSPHDVVAPPGYPASFNVVASGSVPFQYQWRFEGNPIENATGPTLVFTNVQPGNEGHYSVIVSNEFGFAVSSNGFLNVLDFAETLDNTNLTWTTSTNAPWSSQVWTISPLGGAAALQSAHVAQGGTSAVSTTVTGPGTLRFWWSISANSADTLRFTIDNGQAEQISGSTDWQQKTAYLGNGTHDLAWVFTKNTSSPNGYDSGWLDSVDYQPGGTAPIVAQPPASVFALKGTNVTFRTAGLGTPPLRYQWQFNGVDIPGATGDTLVLTNVQLANAGGYRAVIENDFGTRQTGEARLMVSPVVAWGAGTNNSGINFNYGQAVVPSTATNVVALAGGSLYSLGLRSNGTVFGWGRNDSGQTTIPFSATNIIAISAGSAHAIALRRNGTVLAWQNGVYGQTTVPPGATNVTAIAAGWFHNLALKSNGTVVAWGAGTFASSTPHFGQSVVPVALSNVVAVAAGGYHSLALKSDGTVLAWGWNGSGQTNVPAGLSNVIAIAAGASNSVALKRDGTVAAWGNNSFGQTNVPPGLSNVVMLAASGNHVLALKDNATVVAWGDNSCRQTNTPAAATNVVGIAAGRFHSLALVNDGIPVILRQPATQVVLPGTDAALQVLVAGSAWTCQWQWNQTNLPGETRPLLSLSGVQPAQNGDYRLVINYTGGSLTSSVARVVAVSPVPAVVSLSTDQTVFAGSNALLEVSGASTLPINYHWSFHGSNLLAATNASLVLKNVRADQEGNYFVTLSNAAGSLQSSDVFLNVIDLADALDATNLVWTAPTNNAWLPEGDVTHDGVDAAMGVANYLQNPALTTTVSGPGRLTFWWLKNDSATGTLDFRVSGTTIQSTLQFSANWEQKEFYLPAGLHDLTWTSSSSGSTSTGWVDQVSYSPGGTAPQILSATPSQMVPAGTNLTLSISVVGTPPFSYEWRLNSNKLGGATSASLVLSNLQPSEAGTYSLSISNEFGVTNTSVTLAVVPAGPWIGAQPISREMVPHGTVQFAVTAWGSDPLSYQWMFENAPISGATNPVLTLTDVTTNSSGNYRVVITNALGLNISSNATLIVGRTAVVAWGQNPYGQCTVPLGLTNVASIAAGENHSLALKADGTVVAWGWNGFNQLEVPPGLATVIAITAGSLHSLALRQDGTVVGWGWNLSGECTPPTGLADVRAVAAGDSFSLALKRNGTLVAWGDAFWGTLNLPPSATNVIAIASGFWHAAALRADGTVVAWGTGDARTNVPAGLTNVVAIAAGWTYTQALKRDGTVVTWGYPPVVPGLESLDQSIAISVGMAHTVALKPDGTVVCWGVGSEQTTPPANLSHVVQVGAGGSHSLALLNDGTPFHIPLLDSTPPGLRLSPQGLWLRVTGLSGHGGIVLLASTNLQSWQPVFTNPPAVGSVELLDPGATNLPLRFYRVIEK